MELKKEPSNTLIYVSNLPFDTNDEQFKELFKGFNVKTAYVARRKNGKSKGFGFANLEKESEQKAAIEKINGKEFDSRKLVAKIAYNDDRRNENGELKEEFKNQISQTVPSETVVHVSNLEWTVKDEDLKKIFAEFNPKVATVATRRSGRSKGFGFVEFNTKEDQEKALKLNGSAISGRNITVQVSTGYKKNNTTPNRSSNNRFNNRGVNRNTSNNKGFSVVRRNERNERNERKSENTLYISNLPFELDDNDLKQIFAEFNPKNAHIPLRRNGKSKGYGFVEFNNPKDQNEALRALDQSEVNGRVVTIKVSTPKRVTVRRNVGNVGNRNRINNNNNNDNRRFNENRSRNFNNNNNDNRRFNENRSRNFNRNNNNNNNSSNRPLRPKNENREVSSNMVYISNLPFAVDDKGLEEIFKGLKINKAYIARRRNGYSKGFGFVEFSSPEDQQKAIKYNNNEVNGRAIIVQAAFKVENKTN